MFFGKLLEIAAQLMQSFLTLKCLQTGPVSIFPFFSLYDGNPKHQGAVVLTSFYYMTLHHLKILRSFAFERVFQKNFNIDFGQKCSPA